MIRPMKTLNHWLAGTAITVSILGGSTLAEAALPDKPGSVANPESPYVVYAVAAVLGLSAAAISFKPSKRTHLD